jgi:hypothetical protein
MANTSRWVFLSLAAASIAGCEVPPTTTGLNPEGPPQLRQVFMSELTDTGGGVFRRTDGVLAFGWHPDVPNMREGEVSDKTHPVTAATAENNKLRVVFDELLIGNYLEEIQCRDRPDLGIARSWSRVPEGTTPTDIANCAVSDDLLPEFCKGPHATCLMADGTPIGVKDKDDNNVSDGAPDDTRLICGNPDPAAASNKCLGGTPVRLRCGTIEVPLDFQLSYWQPSGNQLVPARQTPENSLGPAIIVAPVNGLLPPSTTCHLEFNDDVTDKDYNRVCASTAGVDPQPADESDDIGDCDAGDLSAFSFTVESLRFDSSGPSRGAVGVPTTRRSFFIDVTAPIDPTSATAANTVFMEGAGTRTDFTVSATGKRITFALNAGAPNLLPNTMYTITITGLRDSFGGAITAPFVLNFTTGT